MSSALPYIAPWQTGFQRYSTQLIPFNGSGGQTASMVVPDGQWWRIIYLSFILTTSATVADRTLDFHLTNRAGTTVIDVGGTAAVPASSTVFVLFGPGLGPSAAIVSGGVGQVTSQLPDVLWPFGSHFFVGLGNQQAGDGGGSGTLAVETYTEDREGVLVPAAASPTPTML